MTFWGGGWVPGLCHLYMIYEQILDDIRLFLLFFSQLCFSQSRFSRLRKRTMHLTNYSVNKRSSKYVQNRDGKAI